MPKPTNLETFKPRRDGKFERKGSWSEVTVGSVIFGPHAGQQRYDLWEIVAMAAGAEPAGDGMTLWFQAKALDGSDRLVAIPPKHGSHGVTFLCDSPDAEDPLPPRGVVSDADRLDLLMTELGATILAQRDNVTGEITCPNYDIGDYAGTPAEQRYGAEEAEHMRVFHGLDATGLDVKGRSALHAAAHTPGSTESRNSPYPHRHVPEIDLQGNVKRRKS